MLVQPKIAVLLAAYNGIDWIDEQIDSILKQKGLSVTIFISVDLSQDGTELIVDSIAAKNNKVISLPYGQRFGSAGKNFFRLFRDVDFNAFDYIALSDQDDIWLDTKISRAVSLISTKHVDVVSSDAIAFWEDGKQEVIKKSYNQVEYDHFFEAAGPGCTYVFSHNVACSIKCFLKNFPQVERLVTLHDWFFYAYCRHNRYKWYIDDKPLILYRQHSNNVVGANNNFKAYVKRWKMISNKWYVNQVKIIIHLIAPDLERELLSRKFLLLHLFKLRRRPRDCFAFAALLLLGKF